jgi:hypothetical protein
LKGGAHPSSLVAYSIFRVAGGSPCYRPLGTPTGNLPTIALRIAAGFADETQESVGTGRID